MKPKQKIVSLTALKKKLAASRRQKKTIAFTNGCFDILHKGHISYLEKAKKGKRVLVLGLNSDRSIRKIKGPKRPIVDERSRAAVLAGLECIDYVVLFHEPTPQKLIESVRPDILIKGADYRGKNVVGADFVRSIGGKVEYIKYLSQYSTTKIINKIVKTCRKK